MILTVPQLLVLAVCSVLTGYVIARVAAGRARDGRVEGLLRDIDQLRRRLAAGRSELAARDREISAEREEVRRLDAQLTSAEIERADLRARLGRTLRSVTMKGRADAMGGRAEAPAAREEPRRDDLEHIRGIGPTIARRLRDHGVTGWRDLVSWSDADLVRVAEAIRTPAGRIRRDRWVAQAQDLDRRQRGIAISA